MAFSLATAAWAQTKAPTKTFTDPGTCVSFEYPIIWKQVKQVDFYDPPLWTQGDPPLARVIVEFLPEGNYYSKTVLSGLDLFTEAFPNLPDSHAIRQR